MIQGSPWDLKRPSPALLFDDTAPRRRGSPDASPGLQQVLRDHSLATVSTSSTSSSNSLTLEYSAEADLMRRQIAVMLTLLNGQGLAEAIQKQRASSAGPDPAGVSSNSKSHASSPSKLLSAAAKGQVSGVKVPAQKSTTSFSAKVAGLGQQAAQSLRQVQTQKDLSPKHSISAAAAAAAAAGRQVTIPSQLSITSGSPTQMLGSSASQVINTAHWQGWFGVQIPRVL